MARIGKIARLSRAVRSQLNNRLQDGGEGKQIVRWLNSLPQVKRVLADRFDGKPINEQNLSDWRQGGYEEWLAHQDILAQAGELAANQQELAAAVPGKSLADHLAAAISFRYAAILAAQGPELDEGSLAQLKSLSRISQAVVKLRRSDQNAARLQIEMERWELARLQLAEDKIESIKRKQREALAAPILGIFKKLERLEKLGRGEAAQMGVEYLHEVETCEDPAHFKSKVVTPETVEKLCAHAEEQAKNPPVKRTPMEAAMDLYTQMGDFIAKSRSKDQAVPPPSRRPSRARRRVRKPVEPEARPYNATARGVQRTDSGRPDDKVQPAPAPAGPLDPAPSPPDSGLSATASPAGAEEAIKVDQG
jgi:hypothetical protein